jgi:hypothetical protein
MHISKPQFANGGSSLSYKAAGGLSQQDSRALRANARVEPRQGVGRGYLLESGNPNATHPADCIKTDQESVTLVLACFPASD